MSLSIINWLTDANANPADTNPTDSTNTNPTNATNANPTDSTNADTPAPDTIRASGNPSHGDQSNGKTENVEARTNGRPEGEREGHGERSG